MYARVIRFEALLCTFVCFLVLAAADVSIIQPAPGANVEAGLIEVQWEDSGIAPPLSELTQFTLSLMTGGNKDDDMLPLTTFESQGSFRSGNSASGTIPAGIAADVDNGFFFRMISTKEAGGVLINYSSRFSIHGLNGVTPLEIRRAAKALDGSTVGPDTVGASTSDTASSTMASSIQSSKTTSLATASSQESTTLRQDLPSATSQSSATGASHDRPPPTSTNVATENPRLSRAAIAGITAAGAFVVAAILGAGLAVFCIRRRRARKAAQEVQEITPRNPFLDNKAELSSSNESFTPPRIQSRATELSTDSMVVEAGPGERRAELDHMAFRAELEGSAPSSPYTPHTPAPPEKGFC